MSEIKPYDIGGIVRPITADTSRRCFCGADMTGAWLTAIACCKPHVEILNRCGHDVEKARAKLVEMECLNVKRCVVCKEKIPENRSIKAITCNDLHSKIWNKSRGDKSKIERLLQLYSTEEKPRCMVCKKPTKAFGRETCGDDECQRENQRRKTEKKRREMGIKPKNAVHTSGDCAYPGCDGSLKGRSIRAVYCSQKCASKASADNRVKISEKFKMRTCPVCRNEYKPKRNIQTTCGDKECRVTFNGAKQDSEIARRRYLKRHATGSGADD